MYTASAHRPMAPKRKRQRISFTPSPDLYAALQSLASSDEEERIGEVARRLLSEALGPESLASLPKIATMLRQLLETIQRIDEGRDDDAASGDLRHRQMLGYLGVLTQMTTESLLLLRLLLNDIRPELYESLKPELVRKEAAQRRQTYSDMRAAGLDPPSTLHAPD